MFLFKHANCEVFTMVPVETDESISKFELLYEKPMRIMCQKSWWFTLENFQYEYIEPAAPDRYGTKKEGLVKLFVSVFKNTKIVTIVKNRIEIK